MTSPPIPFGNLKAHFESLRADIEPAVRRVLDSGWYVLGKEVEAFEREFAAYIGVRHCVGVGNGTDAIEVALRALGIGPGDEVVTVSHTATFTAIGIAGAGATPIFVDVDESTYSMSPASLRGALSPRTRAIVPVHLYGRPADLRTISEIAAGVGVPVIEDVAQAHGATLYGRKLGGIGQLGCFSFYPSKNLGAFGDGGAVTTDDDDLALRLRQIRNGGQTDRYHHEVLGVNSRLDELQAAILRAQLPHLDKMNARRRAIAARYRGGLSAVPGLRLPPPEPDEGMSVYHLFVVRTSRRDELSLFLKNRGIATLIHYPIPAHKQLPFRGNESVPLGATNTVAEEILSLPIYPELSDGDVDRVIAAIVDWSRQSPAT